MREPAQTELHRDLGGEGPDRARRDGVNGGLLDLVGVVEVIHALREFNRPAAGPENHAELLPLGQGQGIRLDPGIGQRFGGGGDGEGNGPRDMPRVFGGDIGRGIEVLDLAGDRRGESLGIEERNAAQSAAAFLERAGVSLTPVRVGREASDSGHDRAPRSHDAILARTRRCDRVLRVVSGFGFQVSDIPCSQGLLKPATSACGLHNRRHSTGVPAGWGSARAGTRMRASARACVAMSWLPADGRGSTRRSGPARDSFPSR